MGSSRGVSQPPPKRAYPAWLWILVALVAVVGVYAIGRYLAESSTVIQTHNPPETEFVNLTIPICPNEVGPVSNISLADVTFHIQLIQWCTTNPKVHGNGTELGGPTYQFEMGTPATPVGGWLNWTSPDGDFEVQYNDMATVHLWVFSG